MVPVIYSDSPVGIDSGPCGFPDLEDAKMGCAIDG